MTLDWLAERTIPLRTLDPRDQDLSDLEPLGDMVGDARVVAVGESAHGAREFYQIKHRILRYLVRELGFSAFVMESGFAESLAVNKWIQGGVGDLDEISRTGITYGFGDGDDMHDQLTWMRGWNETHTHQVRFYGLDLPGSSTSPGPGIRACLARLDAVSGDDALAALGELGTQMEAVARYRSMPARERTRLSRGLAILVERARISSDEVALRCALSVQRLDEMLAMEWPVVRPTDGNPRDQFMADTVQWILDREARIVISAHNGHVGRGLWHGRPVLGSLLDSVLGDAMVVVGTTYGAGRVVRVVPHGPLPTNWEVTLDELAPPPARSLDALMASAGLPLHFLNLRALPDGLVESTAMVVDHDLWDIAPQSAFDAVIHVDHVSPVIGAFESFRDDIARGKSLHN